MSSSSRHSESAKIEQIITEFFAKTLHIILDSRSPCESSRNYSYSGEQTSSPASSTSSTSSARPRDKWFNLALRECPAALENMDLWRQSNLEPMVVDVVLVTKPVDLEPGSPGRKFPSRWDFRCDEMKSEKIIERWIVQYESGKPVESSKGSKRGGSNNSQSLYKKSIILLRSLYLTVRILPAYKLYRDLNSSGRLNSFSLAHRVSSFVEPFTRMEEAEMQKFVFAPVDSSCGRLLLSVIYSPALSDFNTEPLAPISPRFIPDYVGSPTTNPLKRFPSLPRTGFESQGSPSSLPFARRHSWSYGGLWNFAPMSASPSPTYSDSRGMSTKVNPQLKCLPQHAPENPYSASLPQKSSGFDDYWPSPMSPSPSPSPPAHVSKALFRTESAPVGIPTGKLGSNTSLPSGQVPQMSPSPRSSKLNSSQTNDARSLMKLGDVPTKITTQKVSSFGKDEVATRLGAMFSAHHSPRKSFSGRFTLQDDFDDTEFCPFALDDICTADPHVRKEPFDAKGHITEPLDSGGLPRVGKSQNAAVGSMLKMLMTAPPLCQDLSNTKEIHVSKPEIISNKQIRVYNDNHNRETEVAQNTGITASHVLLLKTTSEALEELQVYRDMKDKLLKQDG